MQIIIICIIPDNGGIGGSGSHLILTEMSVLAQVVGARAQGFTTTLLGILKIVCRIRCGTQSTEKLRTIISNTTGFTKERVV